MTFEEKLAQVLEKLPTYQQTLGTEREIVLANAVMFGEVPAPTFGEDSRIRFLVDRFTESDLENISVDEVGNASAIIPGTKGERNILIAAHADTIFPASIDHTVTVGTETMTGAGIADNSLGIAAVASLPNLLDVLDLKLEDNLILLGATRSLGHGDLAGMRFFLDNVKRPIHAAVCVEGAQLGRLSYSCLGMMRGEITVEVREESEWDRYANAGAIADLQRIVGRILAIPTPRVPRTAIILGSVSSGAAFNTPPIKGRLRLELRSEEVGVVSQLQRQIQNIVDEVDLDTDSRATLNVIARRRVGGIPFAHPMVQASRRVMEHLGIRPKIGPSTGELSELIAHEIPGITLGLTRAENVHEPNETIQIQPLFAGLAQWVSLLEIIDGGATEESPNDE